jgi:hypothetical protein
LKVGSVVISANVYPKNLGAEPIDKTRLRAFQYNSGDDSYYLLNISPNSLPTATTPLQGLYSGRSGKSNTRLPTYTCYLIVSESDPTTYESFGVGQPWKVYTLNQSGNFTAMSAASAKKVYIFTYLGRNAPGL